MINNYFLTGELHIGKSTIIDNFLSSFNGKVCGFRTLRYYEKDILCGFYIKDMQDNSMKDKVHFIGKLIGKDKWEGVTSVFDEYGVKILNDSIKNKSDLIIMDELGFFENKAFEFQNKVEEVLSSNIPVLGVIKQADTPFLNKIRIRKDVCFYKVTKKNRDEIYYKLTSLKNQR